MGLIEPVELPDPQSLGPVHFIAIGGSGMNGIASALVQLGVEVSGSDRQDSEYLRALERLGARVHVGHRAEQLGNAATVVASSAIREDNPELAEAHRRGLRILHRSAALGSLMLGRRGIAVAGTHGKTTTTAMISSVLAGCGLDPSFVIGGALTGSKTGGHLGTGDLLVVEADESDGSFLQYPAEVAVVTNVDPDHLVNWGTPENYADGFLRFATGPTIRLLVVSADDPGAATLSQRVRSQSTGNHAPQILTFGESPDADVQISDTAFEGTGSTFTLHQKDNVRGGDGDGADGDGADEEGSGGSGSGGSGGTVTLSVPGHYNVLNAAAAYAVATWLGVAEDQVRAQLSEFGGTYRRFQLVGTVDRIRVFDDYAHHPTEVANTLRAARTGVGAGRVVVCFQPHLYTRTRDFWRELAAALEQADEAVVMDVCGDREDPIEGVDGALVSDAIRPGTAHVTYQPVWDEAAATVAGIARPGDLVITVGCGDVTKIAPQIVAELRRVGNRR
ncbi:MAG TPA: UDP-N-acetylmuramate--L-alanine ligase [Propionibacteriaceae bacterium]|nr:UDP-N-acetylmuramate--L-alanine ligase [Propionibacteriaceae bacterium]